nr:hypothetical protein [Ruminococcus sp.]
MKKLICFVLALALLCPFTAFAAGSKTDAIYQTTEKQLLSCPVPQVGSIGGEWLVIGLARAGILPDETAEGYYRNVVDYINEKGSAKLDRNKSTENSRLILALTAIGKNPEDVNGYNLLQPLADFNFVKKQGINGPVWALIALDSLQYEIPETTSKEQTTREKLIDYLLEKQLPAGGWAIGEQGADPDMTGMAIQALAPYYKKNEAVKCAVDKALGYYSAIQRDDGGLSEATDSPESCAQMITALSALGIDPETDGRFIKSGNSIVDCLLRFSLENGFAHNIGGEYNQMSTEQAFYAMTAANRLREGKSSLYDMCDLLTEYDLNLDGTVDITDATLAQKAIAELETLNLRQLKIAGADSQGEIKVTFVTETQRYIASH